MNKRVLHQFAESIAVGDAASAHALLIRRWLREMDFHSEIYSEHCQKELENEVRPAHTYRPGDQEKFIVYHHAIGSAAADRLLALPSSLSLILIYQNITPPAYFAQTDPALTQSLVKGRTQLDLMRPRTCLALGASHYTEEELRAYGYTNTGVLPIILDESQYDWPLADGFAARFQDAGPVLLFVGRLAPHKKQEDLLKLLYYYRRIEPSACLVLVGSAHHKDYEEWLRELADSLGLSDGLIITGHVNQQEMVSYYRAADLFISMSEHEGFGKPLIESMYLGLPIMAYAATAVPHTLGQAAVLFQRKEYQALAELADILIKDQGVRQRLIVRQKQRVELFLTHNVQEQWSGYLRLLGLL
jgi:L-malate glycosyltransferase